MYDHEPDRVPSQSPVLQVNMALGTSAAPRLTNLKPEVIMQHGSCQGDVGWRLESF
ncbi:hypothetical protein ACRRTK_012017 [Alexandromys fortis]